MHIDIDRDVCEGFGVCAQSAPDVFALDDEGDPVVLKPEVDPDLVPGVSLAEQSCPMQAVRIS